jgi:hypothetical protein
LGSDESSVCFRSCSARRPASLRGGPCRGHADVRLQTSIAEPRALAGGVGPPYSVLLADGTGRGNHNWKLRLVENRGRFGSATRLGSGGGGSLQARRLREVFEDTDVFKGPVRNRTERFIVQEVQVSPLGDLAIGFTDGLRICVFPGGCRGEFWRVFKRGSNSHFAYVGDRQSERC